MAISIGKACGKFILMGEHFVVHQQPALAFPLKDLWCTVRVQANHHQHYAAKIPGMTDPEIIQSLMARAAYAAADAMRLDIRSQPLSIESESNFPVSRGLGSSAGFAVALARALDEYRKSIFPDVGSANWLELDRAADAVDCIYHGKPSGLDTSVIFAGHAIRFENGKIVREVYNRAVDFVIVDGGDRVSCAIQVEKVGQFKSQNSAKWNTMVEQTRKLVDETELALKDGKAEQVAKAVGQSQTILSELGLSTPEIDQLILSARDKGALAGKVSGAGGGGAVVLLAEKGKGRALASSLQKHGETVFAVCEGETK